MNQGSGSAVSDQAAAGKSTTLDRFRRARSPYGLIILAGILAHGWMLLNDGLFFDGWLIHTFLRENNWAELRSMFLQHGSPGMAYFHWAMGHSGPLVLSYRLIALVSILAAGLAVYALARETGWLTPAEAGWLALLSLLYPGMQVGFELINVPYLVCYALFLAGFLAAFVAERTHGWRQVLLRVLALLLLFASFTTNSLLVFHYGFLLLLALRIRDLQGLSSRETVLRYAPKRLDYLILPLLFWVLKESLFPRHGLYAEYNRFQLAPLRLLGNVSLFLVNAVYQQLNGALSALLDQPALLLIMAAAVYLLRGAVARARLGSAAHPTPPLPVLGVALWLLALGCLPYVVVGLAPTVHGWSTRHALLIGLPWSLLFLAGLRLVLPLNTGAQLLARSTVLLAIAVGSLLRTVENQVSWQARWVKDKSLIHNLADLPTARRFSVLWVDDRVPLGGERDYRFYEWSSILKAAWGTQRNVGLDRRTTTADFLTGSPQFFIAQYNLRDFDPAGCQAVLTIRRGRLNLSDAELAARFHYVRLVRPALLDQFLSGVTDLDLEPLPGAPEATRCPLRPREG
ncbi:MAG: hypothetical protein ACREMX_13815 [Gemmatimonadales bacterium]